MSMVETGVISIVALLLILIIIPVLVSFYTRVVVNAIETEKENFLNEKEKK